MMEGPTFNLVLEPFLPCRFMDGSERELSLQDCLVESHEIVDLEDSSPLVAVSLQRFLLGVLHGMLRGPKSRAERVSLREEGRWDQAKIRDYLGRWRDSFDLFHPEKPFYQTGGYRAKDPGGTNKLLHELSAGNNAVIFDHTMDDSAGCMHPALAARALISVQAFAVGGGKSERGYTSHGPLLGKAVCLVKGRNLFETLWLNLPVYSPGMDQPVPGIADDKPWWEKPQGEPSTQPSQPTGWLDILTWQSRTVALHPIAGDKNGMVKEVSLAQGRDFKPSAAFLEPMSAHRKDDEGMKPLGFQETRDLWRDSTALFQFGEADDFQGPATIKSLGQFAAGFVSPSQRNKIALYGLCSDKAKILFWRNETLPLYMEYLGNPQLVAGLKLAIQMAEEVGKDALNSSCRAAAEARLENPGSGSRPDKDRVSSLVLSLGPVRHYWSMVETPFRQLMDKFAQPGAEPPKLLTDWFHQILRPCALRAFDDAFGRLTSGRDLRGHAIGRKKLVMALGKIRNSHNIQAPGSQTIIPEESISHEQ